MSTTTGPLAGVRVIDFCWVGAGSFATKILADHGADVIKIESIAKVDGLRLSPPFADRIPGVNRSGYFADRNSSKRSLAINLGTDEGRALAIRLIDDADVVANNFTSGVMERFGLGRDVAMARNPGLIYLSMSMQGADGPYRDHIGYGATMAASAALHDLTGEPDRPPIGTGTNYPDHVPNPTHAAVAVLAALRHRRRTGEGQWIDMAQVEPTISAIGPAVLEASVTGVSPGRTGNRHPVAAPHNVYRCAGPDRWIAIAVMQDAHWTALVDVLGLEAPTRWDHAAERKRDEAALDALVGAALRGRDAYALARELRLRGVPAGVAATAADLVQDPQLLERGHWRQLDHAEMGITIYASPPFALSETPGGARGPAPMLGEHTVEVAGELLGIPEHEVRALAESGVLA